MTVKTIPGICATLLTASCAMGPTHVEEDFGRSVRQMVDAQISDPAAAGDPAPRAADRLDGVVAEDVLREHREGGRRGSGAAAGGIRLAIE